MREAKLKAIIDRAVHDAVTEANLHAEGRAKTLRDDHADQMAQIRAAHMEAYRALQDEVRKHLSVISTQVAEGGMVLTQQISGLGHQLVDIEARLPKPRVRKAPVKKAAKAVKRPRPARKRPSGAAK